MENKKLDDWVEKTLSDVLKEEDLIKEREKIDTPSYLNIEIDKNNLNVQQADSVKDAVKYEKTFTNKYNPFFTQPDRKTENLIKSLESLPKELYLLELPYMGVKYKVTEVSRDDSKVHLYEGNSNYIKIEPFSRVSEFYESNYTCLDDLKSSLPDGFFDSIVNCINCPKYKTPTENDMLLYEEYKTCGTIEGLAGLNFFDTVLNKFLDCNQKKLESGLIEKYKDDLTLLLNPEACNIGNKLFVLEHKHVDYWFIYDSLFDSKSVSELIENYKKFSNYSLNSDNSPNGGRYTATWGFCRSGHKQKKMSEFYEVLVEYQKYRKNNPTNILNRNTVLFFLKPNKYFEFLLENREVSGYYFSKDYSTYTLSRNLLFWDIEYVYKSEIIETEYLGALSPMTTLYLADDYNLKLNYLEYYLKSKPYTDQIKRIRDMANTRSRWIEKEEIKMTLDDIKNYQKYGQHYFNNTTPKNLFHLAVRKGLLNNRRLMQNMLYYSLYSLKDYKTCRATYLLNNGSKKICRFELYVYTNIENLRESRLRDFYRLNLVFDSGECITVNRSELFELYTSGRLLF